MSAIKIFLDLGDNFRIDDNLSGVVVTAGNLDKDKKLLQFIEASQKFNETVIFKLEPNDLEEELSLLLFAREKKAIGRINISIDALDKKTRDKVCDLGYNIWLELSLPENIINLENYLEGVSGVIIDADKILLGLGGENVNTLIKFLDEAFNILHRKEVPILVRGLVVKDDFLRFLVERGVFGVICEGSELNGLKEHLEFLEKRLVELRTF